ncbi:hypothetical protein [Tissierella pigra]|uniref:Uncharacterized protein n=1 Tax=Tissierella pigra TaxID=2607614 RepID=A0A6N7XVW2_9FIRM|nr:hypothetical protein [Tissierella pigra]MSU01927.1 hypothetical protein [Tissierella pigra]
MAIPDLRKVFPFPSTDDYTFRFNVEGISQQIFYNELEIKLSSDTSQIMYKQRIQEFRYQHTVPANTLENGKQYVAIVKVYNNANILIGESNPIFFYCFSSPILSIPTIVNGEVGSQTAMFKGTYEQSEGELLQSYRFKLYNDNQVLISESPEIYSDTIQYEFSDLESRQKYYIELQVSTINEMTHSTGLIEFTPRYVAPRFSSAIELENLSDEASILVTCNVIRIIGIPDVEPVIYTDDGMVDLRDNGVWFDEGFKLTGNWTIQMWLKDIVDNSVFFQLIARDYSKIELEYKNNKIKLYKMLDEEYIMQILIGENEISTTNNLIFICIKHINGLYDFTYETVGDLNDIS